MLKVKSFKISDDKGINELLVRYRLASQAHILVSDGYLCIPYEDGAQENADQKVISLKEQRNTMFSQLGILIHSQNVMEIQEKGITEKIETAEKTLAAPETKKKYDKKKELEDEIKRLTNMLNQTRNQILMNQSEITRLNTNIKVFSDSITDSIL